MKILLSGGTGFIGTPLQKKLLHAGHEIILLTRHPSSSADEIRDLTSVFWDGKTPLAKTSTFEGIEAVIHLSGEPIMGKRWTEEQKEKLIQSRILSTKLLVQFVLTHHLSVHTWLNASAVGYYGDGQDQILTESSPAGDNFLAEICVLWENETKPLSTIRVVCLRTGFVLEKTGGALKEMVPPFKFFIGGPLGNGKQWIPWIHLQDEISAILFCLGEKKMRGPVNLTAPEPATMDSFCQKLAQTLRRPCWARVPEFVLKLILGERAVAVLTGQRAVPEKLTCSGFRFQYPTLNSALNDIFRS